MTLKAFAAQADEQVLFTPDDVRGVQTRAVSGEFTPRAALERMLGGTSLQPRSDAATGAVAIVVRPAPPPALSPPTTVPSSTPFARLATWFALLTAVAPTGAQVTPTVPPRDSVEVLSPFTVNSTRDQGFVAASALAGGRLATDLKDTPAAYSVLTRDFIEALNITNLTMAQQWTTGFNEIEDDGRQNQFGDGERGRRTFRGVSSNQQQIEFFPAYYDYDSYNLERFDFARGPNSILFGSGSMGGTANGLFKRAQTGRAFGELALGVSSWDSFRTTLDLNQPVGARFALRFNGLWEDTNTWRDTEYYNRRAATLTATYRPWRGGNFRVTAESGDNHRNASLSGMGDRISGWDGSTTFSGRITTPANANAVGVSVFGVNNFIFSPGLMGGGVVDWSGHAFTLGGNANAAVPVGGQLVVGPLANIDASPVLGALNVPDFRFQNVYRGAPKFSVPSRERSTSLGGDSWATKFDNIHLAFDQQFGRHLFVGVSANYSYSKVLTHFTVARGLNNVYIDINRLLPTGEVNPYFLTPYSESTQDFDHVTRRSRNARGNAALVFDQTRFGSFRLNLEAGISDANFSRIKWRMMVQDPNVPSRDWINQIARLRVYWDGPLSQITPGNYNVVVPATGAVRNLPLGYVIDVGRPNDTASIDDLFTYQQAAFGAKLFGNRLNLLAALRRDDFESITNHIVLRGDQPDGWDGSRVIFRPRPPDDYFRLTYVPKNAAGQPTGPRTEALSRPRTNNVPQPQYAADRFRDDYSLPAITGVVNTYSAGGVLHLTRWLSVFGNYAETWLPPAGELRINGERFVPSVSDGWDAGLRLSLLRDRVSLTASRYASRQDNIGRGTGTNGGLANALGNLFNSIANTNVLGDLSGAGINARGMLNVPGNYFDTASRKSKGYEFELTANVTPQWRISANYAIQNAFEVDAYADTRAYIAANDALFRNILGDAGVDVVNGQAVLRAGTTGQNSPDAANAIASYNQMNEIARNLTAAEQKVARLVEGTGNLFTDYTFREGYLKNVRLGLGINYRGREVIGYRGGDSIRTGPTTAADDPAVDATTPVYRDPYTLWTGVVGYSFRLNPRLRVKLDLRISNLFDEDMLLYYTTAQRPPGGEISNPARVATPSQFSFITPRNYTLTATFSF
ncbi:MAG: TonB-dependent receptor [Verrucomicrobia bacterium]|nr:TonB-dependent receptor [Verrucomicrobiota bacterium]